MRTNLQATLYGMQIISAPIDTVSTVGVSMTSAVLMPRLDAMTQCTGTTVHIYLPDKLDSRSSHKKLANLN